MCITYAIIQNNILIKEIYFTKEKANCACISAATKTINVNTCVMFLLRKKKTILCPGFSLWL